MGDLAALIFNWGEALAKQQSTVAPTAPLTVDFWLAMKLRSQGRKDAHRYSQLNDVTRTHAILVAQNRANAGQRGVNQWLIKAATPLHVGNARNYVLLETYDAESQRIDSLGSESGRNRKMVESKQSQLQREIMNVQGQIDSNSAQLESLRLIAEQAMGTWRNYYEQMAGLYARARANKMKANVDSVRAEVPELEDVEIVDFSQFGRIGSSLNAGA